jgi:hypothetical protein
MVLTGTSRGKRPISREAVRLPYLGGERKEVLAAHSSPLPRASGGIDHGQDMGDLGEEEHDDHPLSRNHTKRSKVEP